jgi:hypothetical protein
MASTGATVPLARRFRDMPVFGAAAASLNEVT